MFEPAIIIRRDFPPYTRRLVDMDQIRHRLGVDGEFALGANDLSTVILAGGHHARAVEIGDAAAVELDDADGVVAVVVFPQLGLHGRDAGADDALDDAVLAEEPQGEIDVVDGAVDEDAAAEFGVGDEEARGVEHVAGLGAEDGGAPDEARVHFGPGVAVGGVEAAGEAAHDFEVGFLFGGVDDGLGLFCGERGRRVSWVFWWG